MNQIFDIETLDKLEEYLSKQDQKSLREKLFSELLIYVDYKNVSEWNKAVKICESLTIIGWGEHEPLQAVKGIFFNGNPTTLFVNKFRKPFFVDAIWSKRKNGYTMEPGRTTYHQSPLFPNKNTILHDYPVTEDIQDLTLNNQRNWIPANPILITRSISNCYESSKSVIESIEKELQPELDTKMKPEKYGPIVNRIIFNCSYSFDDFGCKTNYIIADEKQNLKSKDFYPELLKMYSKKEIESNGYFLRNRYEYGPFKLDTGVIKITIHFEKELADLDFISQKEKISEHISESLNTVIDKLKKKKLKYDFDSMQQDFTEILLKWKSYPESKN